MSEQDQSNPVAVANEPIAVSGSLDITVVASLEDKIEAALAAGGDIVIQLQGVERVDTSMAQLFYFSSIECKSRGVSFTVAGECPALDEALRVLGLKDVVARG